MKHFFKALGILLVSNAVVGCAYFHGENRENQACVAMKRQMAFNSRSNAGDARFMAASQHEALKDRYDEYGCS